MEIKHLVTSKLGSGSTISARAINGLLTAPDRIYWLRTIGTCQLWLAALCRQVNLQSPSTALRLSPTGNIISFALAKPLSSAQLLLRLLLLPWRHCDVAGKVTRQRKYSRRWMKDLSQPYTHISCHGDAGGSDKTDCQAQHSFPSLQNIILSLACTDNDR